MSLEIDMVQRLQYTNDMKTMERLLLQLGFEEIQAKLYAEVFFKGKSTVLELAAATGIKRPTVHFHVEKLLEKGILKNAVKGGRRVLVAEELQSFATLVEDQKQHAVRLERSLDKMLAEMSALSSVSAGNGLSVHCEFGADAVQLILEKAYEYGEVCLYSDYSRLGELIKLKDNMLFDTKQRSSLESYTELVSDEMKSREYAKRASVFSNVTVKVTQLRVQSDLALLMVFESKVVIVKRYADWQVLILDQPILADFLKSIFALDRPLF
jgi:predicted DNA-binding transcriptional regulator